MAPAAAWCWISSTPTACGVWRSLQVTVRRLPSRWMPSRALAQSLPTPRSGRSPTTAKTSSGGFSTLGYDLAGLVFDTALASYLLNPATREYDLASIATRYLKLELDSPDHDPATGKQGTLDFSGGPDLDSAGRRVEAVAQLAERLEAELDARDELDLFRRFELPLVPVLARMEHAGIGVDRAYLEEMGADLRSRLSELERRIHQEAGDPFNVNSTNQLREVLYEKLALPVLKKTSTGAPSTDASVLEKLAESHPIVQALAELSRAREAPFDLRGRLSAPDHQRGPDPHPLQPDGRDHWPAVLRHPQPSEHPGPVGNRKADAKGICAEGRLDLPGSRLQPDRACGSLPT